MRTVLTLTFIAHAWTHHFRQAIEVITLQSKTILNFLAHIFCPRFCTESTHTQLQVLFLDTHAVDGFSQIERIRRCAGNACDTQVTNQFGMLFCVTRGSRYHRSTHILHTIVYAKSTREQAIAVCHGEQVATRHTVCSQASAHTLAPNSDVLARITNDGSISCSTRRSVNTNDFTLWSSLKSKRIVVS